MGKIFYLMGKSASGKDTVYKKISRLFPELTPVVIYTTRPIRVGEKDGEEYHFVGEKDLGLFEKEGRVIELREYFTVYGIWKYFTVDDGQFDIGGPLTAIGTPESYMKMKEYFGEERMVPIYLETEDGLRLFRALCRERRQEKPAYEEMCRRFLADSEDFSEENLRKAGISRRFNNTRLNRCVDEIAVYIRENL